VQWVWPLALLGAGTSLWLAGCRRPTTGPSKPLVSASTGVPASAKASAGPLHSAHLAAAVRQPPAENDEPSEETASARSQDEPWIVDDLADAGPAGPASATPQGVVLLTREGSVLLARWLGPLSSRAKPGPTRIAPVDAPAADFSTSSAPPAVVNDAAYFILDGQLVRRKVAGGALETLSPEARNGSRVAAAAAGPAEGELPAIVAYLSTSRDRLVTRLWVEGAGVHDLSPEGTSISSVALARAGDGLMVLSLEGRTSMSPLHARRIRVENGRVELDPDLVVWVGGAAQPLTELSAIGAQTGGTHVFVPIERDITHFGLARLYVDRDPHMDADVWWRNYPNGLEPAPTSSAWICGQPSVLYARPADATPRAPEELHLARITAEGLGPSTVVGRGRRISSVSMAALPQGALVSYVADRRTWACTLHCRQKR
jgi:hypothetical protein